MAAVMMLFGVDAPGYWDLFDTIELADGEFIQPGRPGLMMAEDRVAKLAEYLKRDIRVGDEILIQGMGDSGIRLRSVRITSYNVCYTKLLRPPRPTSCGTSSSPSPTRLGATAGPSAPPSTSSCRDAWSGPSRTSSRD